MQVVTFWCEWDIGINHFIFSNEDIAKAHITIALKAADIEESYDELHKQGLIGLGVRTVIATKP